MKSTKNIDMCNGPLFGKMIRFTVPVILSGLLQMLLGVVDMLVAGRFCGSQSLAAIGATSNITNLIITLFLGLSLGAGVSLSQAIGAGKKKDIDRILHTSIVISVILGFILAVFGIAITKKALIITNIPTALIDESSLYMRIIFMGMPVNLLYNFSSSMLRSAGDSVRPLVYMIIGGVVNILLNIVLVTVVDMGVAGLATATVASQAVAALCTVSKLINGTGVLKIKRHKLHVSMPHLIKIMRIGIPAGLNGMVFGLANTLIQSSVNLFGVVAVAANTAAGSIEGIIFFVTNSFHQTSSTFVGQNMGAKKYERIPKIAFISSISAIVCGIILSIIVFTFKTQLLAAYCPDNPEAVAYGIIRIYIVIIPYFLCGLTDATSGVLRGMGYSFTATLITFIGIFGFRVTWILTVFRKFQTLECLYLSIPVPWLVISCINIIMISVFVHRLKTRHDENALTE